MWRRIRRNSALGRCCQRAVIRRLLCRGGLAALSIASSSAAGLQSTAATTQVRSGTTAIVVDVIVVDAKGNAITNLRKEDFRLLEDGVMQDIGDSTFVGNPGLPAKTATGARVTPEASRAAPESARRAEQREGPTFLAIVFDRLSGEARALAYTGALACVDDLGADDYAAVYVANLSLETIQEYTNDREKLRAAVKDAASRATARFDARSVGGMGQGSSEPSVPIVASAESVGRPVDSRATAGETAVRVGGSTHNTWEQLEREQQGYATTDALLAIATGLGRAPGRKSIMFFAEGLAIPDAVLPRFRDVVASANRSNVSVYTIDAAGLRVHSKDAEMGRAVRGMGAVGLAMGADGSNLSSLTMLEYNEDYLRRDPRTSLTLLAQQTGAFLIDNTNDLASGVHRINADRRSYYLLTYRPKNDDFDGKWRSITVKVPSRNVTVRARSGYLAIRSPGTSPLLTYEGPALAALERTPLPSDLAVRGGAFVFPQPGAADARLAVLITADGGALVPRSDASKAAAQTDFTILARLKDASGEVVRKGSQRYRLPPTLRGDVLFFRQPALPPGSYTLEYVVHDALGQRAGAGSAPVTVAAGRAGEPNVSSLMIVQRAERVPGGDRDSGNPLYNGDVLLYPNLGEPLSKRETPALTFAFMVIAGSAPANASLVLSHDERAIGQTTLPLGAPDAQGRIWHVSQLPTASLAPGTYTLTVTVTAGTHTDTRSATFRLVE